ncbi:GNAT family N-acetyltransferase [Nocardia sp. CDC159]|uniref:GNAT family N-acetyltransferase n=1 Tax=Nocardia pulmonis TaxID=2951408 RepID=A0A9X2IZA8_9NOCA|nr:MULTISPECIES: GNAT family N-acetyltransferase [Nocardia]MCM6776544.1 GNAT family N-acetyltransferase [Nocardia pulmonis]MCM6788968.1 GNAT family N-acetyltransferase [Nocardia sp. CDC159]
MMIISPKAAFEIRPVRSEEYGAVGSLTMDVYVGEGYIDPQSPYVAELSDAEARARAADVLVAVREGVVLGSLTMARPATPYADIARAGELEFRMLAVAKQARGLGVGTALVRTVIDTARREGFAAVVLTTMAPMVDARRIYDRFGFVHVPERDWAARPGSSLMTVMRLALR